MNLPGMTTAGLLKTYNAVRKALEVDDNLPGGVAKVYGVREFADFREWSGILTSELDKRKVHCTKIKW